MAVVRFALYADLMLLFGLPAFLLYNARQAAALDARFTLTIRALAILAPVISALGFALLCADMAGQTVTDLDRATIGAILWQTPIGTAWIARTAALLAYLAIAMAAPHTRPPGSALQVAIAGVALGSLAWTGHGAAGSWMRLLADIAHLLAAGVWIGALGAFVLLLTRMRGSVQWAGALAAMLARFAVVGSLAVAAIVASGMVNAWELVGPEHIADLLGSPYGRLLVIKVLIFVAMLGLAAMNRFRFTPRLERSLANVQQGKTIALLRNSIAIETMLALALLALVSCLGLLEPPTAAAIS